MNPEEIKVGETYNVRMTVTEKTARFIYTKTGTKDIIDGYCFANQESFAFSPLPDPANVTKSAKNAQKYDPCREFKNGDIVRYVERDGRSYVDAPPVGATCRVIVGEDSVGMVMVEFKFSENEESDVYDVPFYHLELVVPVEELERYVVIHNDYEKYYEVCWKDDDEPDGRTGRTRCLTTFWYHNPPKTHTQKHAKEAAEAERDRLNAEYRKEQNNG